MRQEQKCAGACALTRPLSMFTYADGRYSRRCVDCEERPPKRGSWKGRRGTTPEPTRLFIQINAAFNCWLLTS